MEVVLVDSYVRILAQEALQLGHTLLGLFSYTMGYPEIRY